MRTTTSSEYRKGLVLLSRANLQKEAKVKLAECNLLYVSRSDISAFIKQRTGKETITDQDISDFVLDSRNFEDLARLGYSKYKKGAKTAEQIFNGEIVAGNENEGCYYDDEYGNH